MNQVYVVSIAVAKVDQPVALDCGRLREKRNATLAQFLHSSVKIIDGDGQVTNPRVLHLLWRAISDRRNDFKHGAVLRPHEIIAVVSMIDTKIELLDVPLRQTLGIRRRDGRVLQSLEHKTGL